MRFFELFGVLPSNSKVKGLRFFEIFLNFSDFFLRIVSNSKFKDLSFFYIFEFLFFFVFFVFSLDSKQLSFAKHLSMFFPFL